MRNRWWIGAPLAWAAVVAVVAMLAWSVIDSAGDSVLADSPRDPVSPVAPGSPSDQPGDRPSDRPSRSPGGPSGSPSTDDPATVAPSGPSDDPSGAGGARRTSTWQGEAGILRVSCTGSDIRLEGASPSDGYEVDQNERRSGSELEVRFRSADGDRRTEIEARCVDGTPQLAVETDDD